MRVEVWSDIMCPWCGLNNDRLERAVAGFTAGLEDASGFEVVHRSYLLNPDEPVGASMPMRAYTSKKYGWDEAQTTRSREMIEGLAAREGIDRYVVLDNRAGNTHLIHELLAWASVNGKHEEAWRSAFRAFFGESAWGSRRA